MWDDIVNDLTNGDRETMDRQVFPLLPSVRECWVIRDGRLRWNGTQGLGL